MQDVSFWLLKRHISHPKTTRFETQNGTFCNALTARLLHKTHKNGGI